MKTQRSGIDFTEQEMGESFYERMKAPEGLPGIGPFNEIYREIICQIGRPDFIGLRMEDKRIVGEYLQHVGLVGASLLSYLKPESPRTLEYLMTKIEYSADSVKKSLKAMEKSGYIRKLEKDKYIVVNECFMPSRSEVWAFELKLNNARRAIFQAQQNKAFADRTFIVVPQSQIKSYDKFTKLMIRWGIGLASFDPVTSNFAITTDSRKIKPLSNQHRVYAISKMLSK